MVLYVLLINRPSFVFRVLPLHFSDFPDQFLVVCFQLLFQIVRLVPIHNDRGGIVYSYVLCTAAASGVPCDFRRGLHFCHGVSPVAAHLHRRWRGLYRCGGPVAGFQDLLRPLRRVYGHAGRVGDQFRPLLARYKGAGRSGRAPCERGQLRDIHALAADNWHPIRDLDAVKPRNSAVDNSDYVVDNALYNACQGIPRAGKYAFYPLPGLPPVAGKNARDKLDQAGQDGCKAVHNAAYGVEHVLEDRQHGRQHGLNRCENLLQNRLYDIPDCSKYGLHHRKYGGQHRRNSSCQKLNAADDCRKYG